MVTTVDYHVLADNVKTEFLKDVGTNTDGADNEGILRRKKFIFDPPTDIVSSDNGRDRPVLTYILDPSNNAQDIKFEVRVKKNGEGEEVTIGAATLSGGLQQTFFEPFHRSLIDLGRNEIFFRTPKGSNEAGTVLLSSVIVWFKRSSEFLA